MTETGTCAMRASILIDRYAADYGEADEDRYTVLVDVLADLAHYADTIALPWGEPGASGDVFEDAPGDVFEAALHDARKHVTAERGA